MFKAWLNTKNNESLVLRDFQTHSEAVFKIGFNSAEQAIEAGWTRLGTEKHKKWMINTSFIQAKKIRDAKIALIWLLDNDPEPGNVFIIEIKEDSKILNLSFKEAYDFAHTRQKIDQYMIEINP